MLPLHVVLLVWNQKGHLPPACKNPTSAVPFEMGSQPNLC